MSRKLIWLSFVVLIFVLGAGVLTAAEKYASAGKDKPKTLDTDPNLVAWWKFDNVSAKGVVGSSKHQRKGVPTGEWSLEGSTVPGRIGKALKFPGDKKCIKVTGYKGVTGARPRTVAAWINTKHSGGQILSWGTEDFGQMWNFGFIRGRIGIVPKGGYFFMKDTLHDEKWHHVAAVMVEADPPNLHDHVTLYLDGEIAEIHKIGLLDLWPLVTGGDQDVKIGKKLKGMLDDVRIYDRDLSDEEVKALFKLESDLPLNKAKK